MHNLYMYYILNFFFKGGKKNQLVLFLGNDRQNALDFKHIAKIITHKRMGRGGGGGGGK